MSDDDAASPATTDDRTEGISPLRVATAKQLYAQRRERDRSFGELALVFRDPALDIALDLFVAAEERRSVSASSAAIASRTPMLTGLRCNDRMIETGVIRRTNDPVDARRSLVSLTDRARSAMTIYLDATAWAV